MIVDAEIIVFYKLYPSSLLHVQLLVSEYVLEAFVIGVDITPVSNKVVMSCLESMNYDS
jgi:hypothetical protein